MEAYEQLIKEMGRWLRDVEKLASEVTKLQLARLKTLERVLGHIRLQNETDSHIETYQIVCIIFMDCIVLITRTALISEVTGNISRGKSHIPEILQPKVEEIKGYLNNLQDKNKEIDLVINEIEEKLKRRKYKLTEEEKVEVKMLLKDVKAKSQQAKIYFEAADETLESLFSDVETYRREQGVSKWNVFLTAAAGAGVAALGAAFWPVVAPAAAACGGGIFSGIGAYLYAGEVNDGEYQKLRVESKKLESRLNTVKKDFKAKKPNIDKVTDIFEGK